jgi:hypothetical protein
MLLKAVWADRRLVAEDGRGTGDWGGVVCRSEVVSLPLSTLLGEGGAGG